MSSNLRTLFLSFFISHILKSSSSYPFAARSRMPSEFKPLLRDRVGKGLGVSISKPPNGLCLEKIGDGAYLDMVPHPDGSNRAFLANLQGKVWLASIPDEGSNGILEFDESRPFLDISDCILFDSGHDVNCDPSKLSFDDGVLPCQYHVVVAEFTVNGTASEPTLAESAKPLEVRRIFTMGVPYRGGHAGQILFGPADGYLYLMMTDGSDGDDPYNFAQNKRSLLGKILRIDVDNLPSTRKIKDQGLWGNYSIPRDNPFLDDRELEPEIFALGLRDPWRCSFDSKRPSYFLCGDSGQDRYEEINVVKKGGNYGWRVYEGPLLFQSSESPGGNTSASSIHPIFPILGYTHSEIDNIAGSASIVGGYFYRSMTDPCMYGRYLYTDLYAGSVLIGAENPEASGNFTRAKIPCTCAPDSSKQCSFVKGSSIPVLGASNTTDQSAFMGT
ncbi:hypothetical protein K1719_011793 [Acacia pycnantha]|nr:hypothetical protein K1719_011793 [Acacia pycnantha]